VAQNTGRGITYPENTDSEQIWVHYQNLATTADTAIGVIQTEVDSLAASCPFATATVTATVSGSGASSYTQAFTWPVGRFTVAPMDFVTNEGGTGSSGFYIQMQNPSTTSGGTLLAAQRDGATATITSMTVHVTGLQMTAGSATG
jgi:carbohydrate-selective porin OprB